MALEAARMTDHTSAGEPYDVAVIGAGHAGCEAALAAARMGSRTLLVTMNLDTVALMPCNPSIGGPAKGHVVRELDALGGAMGRIIDRTFIQIRMLNTGKGPAVQVPRAQADKRLYSLEMKKMLERQSNLTLKQATISQITRTQPLKHQDARFMLRTHTSQQYAARTLVVTAGTSLKGRTITGESVQAASRAGEPPAMGISDCLREWGLHIGRLKTGTPPRIDARSIDFSKTTLQPGSPTPLNFGFYYDAQPHPWLLEPNPIYPTGPESHWRPQMACHGVATNPDTHKLILQDLDRAPMFNGSIQAQGPRYCPSIEDKIHRFRDKHSHVLFLEPEGWETNEVYVQGANTSLPEDTQIAMLRSITGLERAEIMRVGYAVEYDYVPPSQTMITLESKVVDGLFFAGQINGTSGYEEAAGQGFLAGVNASRKTTGSSPLILGRNEAYIGVMADDLVTRELEEPYRLMTSRAEFRLLLRQDNADLRLTPIAHKLGLVDAQRMEAVERKRQAVDIEMDRLSRVHINPSQKTSARLRAHGQEPPKKSITGIDLLRRPNAGYSTLIDLGIGDIALGPRESEQVEVLAKYASYVAKQQTEVDRIRRLEERPIPADFDYLSLTGLKREASEKLQRIKPATIGQASRIMGVTQADLSILLVHLERTSAAARLTK